MVGDAGTRPDDAARYELQVVAELLGLPPRRLRRIERLGLLAGEVRRYRRGRARPLYSETDLERLRVIGRLVDDLGVNLAGVEVILNMRERMLELRAELERLRRELEAQRGR